jgi:hypothetical protein
MNEPKVMTKDVRPFGQHNFLLVSREILSLCQYCGSDLDPAGSEPLLPCFILLEGMLCMNKENYNGTKST